MKTKHSISEVEQEPYLWSFPLLQNVLSLPFACGRTLVEE